MEYAIVPSCSFSHDLDPQLAVLNSWNRHSLGSTVISLLDYASLWGGSVARREKIEDKNSLAPIAVWRGSAVVHQLVPYSMILGRPPRGLSSLERHNSTTHALLRSGPPRVRLTNYCVEELRC